MNDVAAVLQQSVQTINALQMVIQEMQPLAEFGQAIMDDGQCYGFSTAAKMLSPKLIELTGHDLGRNRLINTLKAMGILNEKREPYQAYATYFKVVPKKTPIGIELTSLLTGKGLAWILPKLVGYYK
jgi:phage antirepressor YoqD-like protein